MFERLENILKKSEELKIELTKPEILNDYNNCTKYLNKELEVYKEKDEIEYEYMLYYNWTKKEYENTKLRELTEEEKESLNHKLINEMEDSF